MRANDGTVIKNNRAVRAVHDAVHDAANVVYSAVFDVFDVRIPTRPKSVFVDAIGAIGVSEHINAEGAFVFPR